jgi:hypothetical protein
MNYVYIYGLKKSLELQTKELMKTQNNEQIKALI